MCASLRDLMPTVVVMTQWSQWYRQSLCGQDLGFNDMRLLSRCHALKPAYCRSSTTVSWECAQETFHAVGILYMAKFEQMRSGSTWSMLLISVLCAGGWVSVTVDVRTTPR